MFKRLLFIALCLFLSACSRAPDAEQLRQDLEHSLVSTFGPDLFTIAKFTRKGSAVDSSAPAGETRRVIYYNVALTLNKDIELGAWDQPGAAALVTLVGAGPRSITGVKSSGNQAGDTIVAHASAIYRQVDTGWEHVAPAPFSSVEAPALDSGAPPSVTTQLLRSLEHITHSVPYTASGTAQRVVQQELERSVTRINGRLARLQQGNPLAGGPDKGEYLTFAQALSSVAREHQVRVLPLITGGSADNIELLRSGDAVIGLAQADIARLAYEGTGPFAEHGPFTGLRTLGSLYPELVHVIVRQDAGIRRIQDLKGRTISLGPRGSGARTTLENVLLAHGLQAGRDYQLNDAPFATALQQLDAGEIDAVTQVIGIPAGPLRLAMTQANLKLLPLEPTAIEKLLQSDNALMALDISEGTYPNQNERIHTVGTAALMLTTSELTPDEAAIMTQAIYQAGQDLLAAGSAQGAQVSIHTARSGLTVPLHAGAIEAFKKLDAADKTVKPARRTAPSQ